MSTTETDSTNQSTEHANGVSAGSIEELLRSFANKNAEPKAPEADEATKVDEADDDEAGDQPEGRGSKSAVLADLAGERDKRQKAETELAEFRAKVAELFGVEAPKSDDDAPTKAEIEAARAEARTAQVELSVVRNAPEGVDVAALLDSSSFRDVMSKVDPTDSKAVKAKVEKFVADHPRFTVQAPAQRRSTRDAAARPTGQGQSKTMDDLIRGL